MLGKHSTVPVMKKTTDLGEKCMDNNNHQPGFAASMSQFLEAETFLNTLRRFIVEPSDWHAGMVFMQALFSAFRDIFLQHLYKKLGWKRVQKDVRKLYFNCIQTVDYVYHQLLKILMQFFLSSKSKTLYEELKGRGGDVSNANWFCFCATRFDKWIAMLHESTYEWLCVCLFFVQMSRDVLFFVRSHRAGDSIGVDLGYQRFAPVVWCTGQHRY